MAEEGGGGRNRKGLLRSMLAVAAGFVIFGGSSELLFVWSGVDPHGPSSLGFRVFGVGVGIMFALVAGAVAARIGVKAPARHALVLSALIAAASIVSLAFRPGEGAIWTQVSSLVLFAPAAALGGHLLARRRGIPGESGRG